jgi:biopolymer transport protein ExbD
MAGVNVDGGSKGKRKTLDSEINMIPMIDLLMVTISFLLITAVWTHMSRVDANAMVPGRTDEPLPPSHPEKQLHVMMKSDDRFVLVWKEGQAVVDSIEVPQYGELAARIASEWKTKGLHTSETDRAFDQAVLHTDNRTEFRNIIAVIDAIYGARRTLVTGAKRESVPAFNVTFATSS